MAKGNKYNLGGYIISMPPNAEIQPRQDTIARMDFRVTT